MEKENKRPQVFVARKLTTYNENNQEITIGYYVSKAYLINYSVSFNKDGKGQECYTVVFDGIFHRTNEIEIYAENDWGKETSEAFIGFNACKEYVEKINKQLLFRRVKGKRGCEEDQIFNQYKKAKEIGKRLENEHTTQEEREKLLTQKLNTNIFNHEKTYYDEELLK